MTKKQQGVFAIISASILLIIGIVVAFAASKIKPRTAFDYIKSLGATPSTSFPGSYEYNGYRFFSNNRAARLSDGKKGTYDKDKITFDGIFDPITNTWFGQEVVQLNTIFK